MKKIAVVTGSDRGIGRAIARALGDTGYHVLVSNTSGPERAAALMQELHENNICCDYKKCDISSEDDRDSLFEFIGESYGRLDVLVNNAGVAPLVRADLLETSIESFDRVMKINLYGTFFMAQGAAKLMVKYKPELPDYSPRIINISSVSAYASSCNRPEYCISKAGISMITKLFGERLAQEGILTFEIQPGIIKTDMTAPVTEKYEKLINDGITPLHRFGQPEDVARAVLAACSGLLDFTTAQVLSADGGFHLRRL